DRRAVRRHPRLVVSFAWLMSEMCARGGICRANGTRPGATSTAAARATTPAAGGGHAPPGKGRGPLPRRFRWLVADLHKTNATFARERIPCERRVSRQWRER